MAGLALALGIGGCDRGPVIAEVKGRVTYKGQPVSGGARVFFENEDKGTFIVAKLNDDGHYRLEMAGAYGLPANSTYDVSVLPPDLNPAFPSVPKKYRDKKTSGLKLTLPKEGAVFDIDMQPDHH